MGQPWFYSLELETTMRTSASMELCPAIKIIRQKNYFYYYVELLGNEMSDAI